MSRFEGYPDDLIGCDLGDLPILALFDEHGAPTFTREAAVMAIAGPGDVAVRIRPWDARRLQ